MRRNRKQTVASSRLAVILMALTFAVSTLVPTPGSAQEKKGAIIQAIGIDAWEGYKALRGCNPERASALAGVAATSRNLNHQLAALWLEAMVAVDSRNTAGSKTAFDKLVRYDPEIDTAQQASLAAEQAVPEMRFERSDIGITCR